MIKLLGVITLVLALVLFPPAALALVSNNAIPGDFTYQIKRKLEDIIVVVASINPTSKTWFSAARSDRRFTEASLLLAQGKKATETLNELVTQTETTVIEVNQVSDVVKKEELKKQLSVSIAKYDQGLANIQTQMQISASSPTPSAIPTPTITATPNPVPQPNTASPVPVVIAPIPSPMSSVLPVPVSAPAVANAVLPPQQEILETRKKLEELKKKLETPDGDKPESPRSETKSNQKDQGKRKSD